MYDYLKTNSRRNKEKRYTALATPLDLFNKVESRLYKFQGANQENQEMIYALKLQHISPGSGQRLGYRAENPGIIPGFSPRVAEKDKE